MVLKLAFPKLKADNSLRAMLHDEKMYPDPFKLNPERWLDSDGKLLVESKAPMHPFKAAFGFGRR